MIKKRIFLYLLLLMIAMIVGYLIKTLIFPIQITTANNRIQHQITLTKNEVEQIKLAPFFERLTQDGFTAEPFSSEQTPSSFYNCQTDEEYLFNGSGVESFYFRRTTPINSPIGKVYPDFIVSIFTFASPEQANQYRDKITASHYYNSNNEKCDWDKTPWTIVSNGKRIFYFTTRADMLCDFTEKYRHVIQKMNL